MPPPSTSRCTARRSALIISDYEAPRTDGRLGTSSRSISEPLGPQLDTEQADAGDVAARPVEARNQPRLDRVDRRRRTRSGSSRSRPWPRAATIAAESRRSPPPAGGPDRPPMPAVDRIAVRPAIFDRDVLALDIARFAQALRNAATICASRSRASRCREIRSPASPAAARAPRAATRPPRRRAA